LKLTRLEDLIYEFSNDIRDKGWIGVSEKRHRSHQRSAIEIDDILKQKTIASKLNYFNDDYYHYYSFEPKKLRMIPCGFTCFIYMLYLY
jgi:hypothetical protein